MNNGLIKTDTLWYKIKKFFKEFFHKKEKLVEKETISQKHEEMASFAQNISLKEELERENRNRNLADDIMHKKISIESLSVNQVNEMILYFEQYITDMNKELFEIKNSIIKIRKN